MVDRRTPLTDPITGLLDKTLTWLGLKSERWSRLKPALRSNLPGSMVPRAQSAGRLIVSD